MNRRFVLHAVIVCLSLLFVSPALGAETAFRIVTLRWAEPHLFASSTGCTDLTDALFNTPMETSIQSDQDGDGLLDLSNTLVFDPLDPSAPVGVLGLTRYDCSVGTPSLCTPNASASAYSMDYANVSSGPGLTPIPGTTHPYDPVNVPSGPCFVTNPTTVYLDLGAGWLLMLRDARIAASYVDSPATGLATGVLRGFLPKADAEQTAIPSPLFSGTPLSRLLPGGSGSCTSYSDLDVLNGVEGWWCYFNFTAVRVSAGNVAAVPATWGRLKVLYR